MAASTKKVKPTPPQDADGFIADHCEGVDKDYYREKSAANTAKHEAVQQAFDEAWRSSPIWGPVLQRNISAQRYAAEVDDRIAAATDAFNKEHPWVSDKDYAAKNHIPIQKKYGNFTQADYDAMKKAYKEKIKKHRS